MATSIEYMSAAMRRAQYEQMEDGQWFASIPGLDGLWATGALLEEAREQLIETLEGWIPVHAEIGKNRLPDIDGISLDDLPTKVAHD